jgi:predicted dehydrogenase
MSKKVRIGVVGASTGGGWAHYAHMPALAAIPEIEVAAIATTRAESAASSAAHYGVANGYSNLAELLASDVDLVAVSVRAPDHARVSEEVLRAGKHLFVEWPMGANLAQSNRLVQLAEQHAVRGFVGLQARAAPAVRHAAELIADGYLGRIHSVSIQAAYPFWGDPVTSSYSADRTCGATVLTIPGGHGLDLMRLLAGEVTSVNARTSHLRKEVRIAGTGELLPMTSPDQFAAVGTLETGAVFSAHFDGMAPTGLCFRMAVNGDRGELLISGSGMPEIAPLALSGTREKGVALSPIAIPQSAQEPPFDPANPAYNVYGLWKQIAGDLTSGSEEAPSLRSGLATRNLLDAIERSADDNGGMVAVG